MSLSIYLNHSKKFSMKKKPEKLSINTWSMNWNNTQYFIFEDPGSAHQESILLLQPKFWGIWLLRVKEITNKW